MTSRDNAVIEVKLILNDAVETNMVAQLMQMIEMKRAQDNARSYEVPAQPQGADKQPGVDPTYQDVVEVARAVGVVEPEQLVKTDDGELTAAAPAPSDIEVARAITTFAQRNGIEKARELLTEFGAKKVIEIPDEQRAAFVARASA